MAKLVACVKVRMPAIPSHSSFLRSKHTAVQTKGSRLECHLRPRPQTFRWKWRSQLPPGGSWYARSQLCSCPPNRSRHQHGYHKTQKPEVQINHKPQSNNWTKKLRSFRTSLFLRSLFLPPHLYSHLIRFGPSVPSRVPTSPCDLSFVRCAVVVVVVVVAVVVWWWW